MVISRAYFYGSPGKNIVRKAHPEIATTSRSDDQSIRRRANEHA